MSYGPKKPAAVKHPIGCPICGVPWVFRVSKALDVIPGVLLVEHAPGECVPLPPVPTDNERVAYCAYDRCGREFDKRANAQKFCSGRCRDKANSPSNRASWRRWWRRRKAA